MVGGGPASLALGPPPSEEPLAGLINFLHAALEHAAAAKSAVRDEIVLNEGIWGCRSGADWSVLAMNGRSSGEPSWHLAEVKCS